MINTHCIIKRQPILFVFALLFAFSACHSTDAGDDIDRAYQYIAQNPAGDTDAARGRLELRFDNTGEEGITAQITGTWKIDKRSDAANMGPQTGEGELRGMIRQDGSVRIDLNPDIADQNVVLTGSFRKGDRSLLEGRWTYTRYLGATQANLKPYKLARWSKIPSI